jgi:hypothetical protein
MAREVLGNQLTISAKPGWSLGWVSAVDSKGRTMGIADAHRDDGKRFVAKADEKLNKQIVVLFCERKILRCIFAGISLKFWTRTHVGLASKPARVCTSNRLK